ncbi:MAG: glutathione synthase, partial [Caulobacterales bacterium]|nr:glutathione synthase [Caulobacterales bacterium]
PPFDIGYVANTQILDLITDDVLVVNSPAGVRDLSEKLSSLRFPDLMPDTIVARDKDAILAFAANYETVVLKRLFLAGGESVTKSVSDPATLGPLVEAMIAAAAPEPVMVQAFIPAASAGDKRVMFVEGDLVGVLRRVPAPGEFRANIHIGGHAEIATLDNADLAACSAVAQLLREHDILFAGIDILDGRLIEINVTSPTLVRELKRCGGPDVPPLILDAIERRLGLFPR